MLPAPTHYTILSYHVKHNRPAKKEKVGVQAGKTLGQQRDPWTTTRRLGSSGRGPRGAWRLLAGWAGLELLIRSWRAGARSCGDLSPTHSTRRPAASCDRRRLCATAWLAPRVSLAPLHLITTAVGVPAFPAELGTSYLLVTASPGREHSRVQSLVFRMCQRLHVGWVASTPDSGKYGAIPGHVARDR